MAAYRPSSEDLESAHQHVLWELEIFHAAVEARLDPRRWKGQPGMYGVFTDSVLLHARCLHAFFTGLRTQKDDILATHFVTNPDGSPWVPFGLQFVESCIDDINKFRGHLTYSRRIRERKWRPKDIARIHDEIEQAFSEFVEMLPKDQRNRWQV